MPGADDEDRLQAAKIPFANEVPKVHPHVSTAFASHPPPHTPYSLDAARGQHQSKD